MVKERGLNATYECMSVGDVDNPDVSTIMAYWEALRGGRLAPPWSAFDWSEIPTHCIPNVTVVDVSPDPFDFIYRFWGTNLAQGQKQEMTGHSVRALKPREEGVSIFNQFAEVCEARKPIVFRSSVKGWMQVDLVGIALRMPFSDDGKDVSHIVSCVDFQQAYSVLELSLDDPWSRVDTD